MKLDDLKARLREQAVEIDEDWASDIQEGGNAPKPVNIPAEALTAITDLEALVGELGEALVTAMIPIEAMLLSGADAAHCQDVRDAMHDAQATARATLAKLEKARG